MPGYPHTNFQRWHRSRYPKLRKTWSQNPGILHHSAGVDATKDQHRKWPRYQIQTGIQQGRQWWTRRIFYDAWSAYFLARKSNRIVASFALSWKFQVLFKMWEDHKIALSMRCICLSQLKVLIFAGKKRCCRLAIFLMYWFRKICIIHI